MAKVATVFGGSGFVGRYIVKRLAKEGWVVRVAVRDTEKAHFLQPYGNVGQIVRMPVPIQDETAVREAVDGADAVFNAIGLLFEPGGAQTFDEVHVNGPERIARLAAETGVKRLIHVSAIGADKESDSVYARTKAEGETAILKQFPQATILRPSIVIGPEDGFLNFFAQMARISPALPLIGGGKTRFQPVYVGDVADAAMAAVHESKTKGKTYELGGPKVYTFKQLMELLLKEIRRKRLLLPIPFGVAQLQAGAAELLPKPLLTRDQVTLLKQDNVVQKGALSFKTLGLEPQAIEAILPTYLVRYRPGGRFSKHHLPSDAR
ncbi:complex I NDUFA9 subunit family protein [Rhodovibrio sodomensis]|uniref:Complex I NDUFA9 subunit family protein n=1 Tax=Rhodovibrio sodomensis TaxID=1088 RepID=A0ABS1DCH5_9PROT|nr:complex I NDUFA9 subunit family protein [Rhodovibrio sodomensis]MBK1667919.1 complex I NDUFA9 subunit family protein [Rhodovibrio sodomensis]